MAEAWEQQLGLCTSGDELIKVFEEIEAALRDRTIEEPISKAWFISLGRGEKTRHGDEVWTASVAKQFGCIIKLFKDLGVDGVVSPTSAPVDEKEDDVVPPFGDIAKAYYDSQGDFAGTFEMHIDTVSEPSEVSDTVVRVLIRYKFKPVAGKQVNCLRYGGSSPNHGWDSRVFEFQKPSGDGSTVLLKMHGYKSAQAELPVPE